MMPENVDCDSDPYAGVGHAATDDDPEHIPTLPSKNDTTVNNFMRAVELALQIESVDSLPFRRKC